MGREKQEKTARQFTAQSFCRMNDRLEFAKQIVGVAGDASKAQDVFAFFCYFVAFNILYEFNRGHGTHWDAVKRFIEGEYAVDCQMLRPADDVRFPLLKGKVLNGRKILNCSDEAEKSYIENEPNENVKVFLRILQIRNNLFHGSKDLNDHRDIPLIREANIVLREFLHGYFERRQSVCAIARGIEE